MYNDIQCIKFNLNIICNLDTRISVKKEKPKINFGVQKNPNNLTRQQERNNYYPKNTSDHSYKNTIVQELKEEGWFW